MGSRDTCYPTVRHMITPLCACREGFWEGVQSTQAHRLIPVFPIYCTNGRYPSYRDLLLTSCMHFPLACRARSRVREHIPAASQAPPAREPSSRESLGAHEVSTVPLSLSLSLSKACGSLRRPVTLLYGAIRRENFAWFVRLIWLPSALPFDHGANKSSLPAGIPPSCGARTVFGRCRHQTRSTRWRTTLATSRTGEGTSG